MKSRYLGFYCFTNFNELTFRRLIQLERMNPNVTFIPCLGIQQRIFIPALVNLGRGSLKKFHWLFLKSKHIFEFSRVMTKRVESVRRKVEIQTLQQALNQLGMKLHCDFTPMGYYNLDLAILNWFSSEGCELDFDFLLFFEHDMYATKTIESLYDEYTDYDAGFVWYQKASQNWFPYKGIYGKESIIDWMRTRKLNPGLYRGLFAGAMISRKVLLKLQHLPLPYGFCEMRLPSIIAGFGYSCVRLNFPMVQYRPPFSKADVEANSIHGLFHPVYEDVRTEQVVDWKKLATK